jgi:hypothetical protein
MAAAKALAMGLVHHMREMQTRAMELRLDTLTRTATNTGSAMHLKHKTTKLKQTGNPRPGSQKLVNTMAAAKALATGLVQHTREMQTRAMELWLDTLTRPANTGSAMHLKHKTTKMKHST